MENPRLSRTESKWLLLLVLLSPGLILGCNDLKSVADRTGAETEDSGIEFSPDTVSEAVEPVSEVEVDHDSEAGVIDELASLDKQKLEDVVDIGSLEVVLDTLKSL